MFCWQEVKRVSQSLIDFRQRHLLVQRAQHAFFADVHQQGTPVGEMHAKLLDSYFVN
ncbi:MAG: hypothetical protein QM652_11840 [Legionella sp.]|uniref:hypothetical protein n=1 Tax=Legionella sp. TaxID=459 RepID=UPI0039E48E9C